MLILCCLAVAVERRTKSGGIRNAWTQFFSGLPGVQLSASQRISQWHETSRFRQIQEALRVIWWVMRGRPYPESIRSMGTVYLPFIYHKNHQSMWGKYSRPMDPMVFLELSVPVMPPETWQNHLTNPSTLPPPKIGLITWIFAWFQKCEPPAPEVKWHHFQFSLTASLFSSCVCDVCNCNKTPRPKHHSLYVKIMVAVHMIMQL